MTIWDNIYQEKKKTSKRRSTPSERYCPILKKFLEQSPLKTKHVLDIGCGIGTFLKMLQTDGFVTDGIDSSQTAIEMTKELLGDDSDLRCVDMFAYKMPKNTYDLIISILTIHHGTKEQIQNLITDIYEAIRKEGKIFITLPDFESSKRWDTFKDHEKIGEGMFIPLSGPEKGLPHSFYTKEEIQKLFSRFKDVYLELDEEGNRIVQAAK